MRRTALMLALTLTLAIAVEIIGQQIANALQLSEVGLGLVPTFAVKDPATGELRGVAMDLARALAARPGVELLPVEYPSPPSVLEGLKSAAWMWGF
uniref:Extracellular solute-binding protein n=1 Tax=uncultured delta proteobacterium Rifle_16ft_4_minimus_1997 TaxID=1665176 RepID=A0A0H4T475_9DELT|nr:extracellular solute-binding protein [uncultured delta proteobacterium Rifle_16ft_4_minimus_1997]